MILETGNTTKVTGSYTEGSAGTLTVDLGAATGFGNLTVSGELSLTGALLVNTAFTPTTGSSSTILASGSLNTRF